METYIVNKTAFAEFCFSKLISLSFVSNLCAKLSRGTGLLRSKNKMLSYNVHKFTISITIIRSQSVHSTHIHDVYYYDNVILPFGIYIICTI